MDYAVLGRTGLRVSVMGLGCGGPSRAGQSSGKTENESVAVIREAIDSGINIIDTSEAYGTETLVGKAVKEAGRDGILISTKKKLPEGLNSRDVVEAVEASLKRLGTECIDIYHLHALKLPRYDFCCREIVPALLKLREQGKIRYLGVTEHFGQDLKHGMLKRALQDGVWDVVMVGFNILNQSAVETVFPAAQKKNIGVMIMFAVRRALSRPDRLNILIGELIEKGLINSQNIDPDDPLGFLTHPDGAVSVTDAAYRFCRFEPGVHVVLSGTGNPEHLRANITSFSRPPLPEPDVEHLREMFSRVDCVSGG